MKALSTSIFSLSFSLLLTTGALAQETGSFVSQVNRQLQEKIESRMKTTLEKMTGPDLAVPFDAGRFEQVRGGSRQAVEVTDCPCVTTPLAG